MLYRLRRSFKRWRFDRATTGVLRTAPVASAAGAPLRVVSMLHRKHLRAYLLAVKGFLHHLGRPPAEIHVLDDGTLGPAERAALAAHLPGLSVSRVDAIDVGPCCPRGGCWERLLHVLDLSETAYVVQIDSDVLATAPLPEVAEAIRANRSFTLGTAPDFRLETVRGAAARVAGERPDGHIQVAAEQALARLPEGLGGMYIRGSAGFAGFARAGVGRGRAEGFSAAMGAALGRARWAEWGTEQVASNFLVANSPGGGLVLPWDRYACFYGETADPRAALLHFIGAWRFDRGAYARLAREVVADLRRA